ncbi:MAG: hypothetical protein ACRD0R_05160, partial [Acidimicrobiales bacterium]
MARSSQPDAELPPVPGEAVSWRELLAQATSLLRAAGFDNAAQEARWLVERATGLEPGELALSLDQPATGRSATHVHGMLERRLAGEPLQYV